MTSDTDLDPPARGINTVDLLGGGAMFILCAAFAWLAWGYGIGRPARMGAGFFPFWFGMAGMVLSGAVIIRAFFIPGRLAENLPVRALTLITAGVIAFGLMIQPLGLAPAVFVSTMITAFADRTTTLKEALGLSLVLVCGVWVVFVYLLGLNIPFVRWGL